MANKCAIRCPLIGNFTCHCLVILSVPRCSELTVGCSYYSQLDSLFLFIIIIIIIIIITTTVTNIIFFLPFFSIFL